MFRCALVRGLLIVAGIAVSSANGLSADVTAKDGSIASGRDTNIFIGPLNEEALNALAGRSNAALDDLAKRLLSIRKESDVVPAFCSTYGMVGTDDAKGEYGIGMDLLQRSESEAGLNEAVASFCKVIPVWATRNRRNWSWAQHNLGEALWRLALIKDNETAVLLLQVALNAVNNAFRVFSPSDRSESLGWEWNNIMRGNVLLSLAEIKEDHGLASESIEAYREAERAAQGEHGGDVLSAAQEGLLRARGLLRSLEH